ncbi:MAG: phage antirepressor KilAC domain-containing protein [Pseudomonas sp.]|nr:phage antirepressor KilAC domain-containing protein [Pseudomonas sp.]
MIESTMASRDAVTMSSREMADLAEKRHDSVKRTIDTLAKKGVIGVPHSVEYLDSLGRPACEYRVGKRDSYVIVAQLSPEFTARLVDRWQELEQQAPTIPRTLPEALRLAADLAEQNNGLRLVVQQQAPHVAALGRIAQAQGTMCLTDAAKHLGVQRKAMLAWMVEHRWIYRRAGCAHWLGFAPRLSAGLLEHKVTVLGTEDDGEQRLASQVRVTPKGLTVLAQQIGGAL